jgi:hypothetical protein
LPVLYGARNPIQIKSHGQKLVGKWEAGENIFVELNNYESMMGSEVQVVSSSETESDDDDFVVEDAPGLIHDASLDEDEPLVDWMTPSSEPLPTAASLCNLFTPTPKMQVTVKSNLSVVNFQENEMPLLHRHFGSAKPISFISSVEEERRATFSKSPASDFRRGDDFLAAMLLCQLASAKNASRDALLAPRPAFSSSMESNAFDCSLPRQSNFPFEPIPILSTTSEMEQDNESLLACYQFEPIPISSITSEMEQDNESLLACYPLILEEQTSNVISPTAFAEV